MDIKTLEARRDEAQTELDAILATATDEKRTALTEDEDAKFQTLADEIRKLDERTTELRDMAARKATADEARKLSGDAGKQAAQVTEPDLYQREGRNGNSYFRDFAMAKINGDPDAVDRLRRNSKRESELRALGNTGAVGGSGGEWAPPGWVIDEWINLIRPGRITAELFTKQPIPSGVSSINYPKISSGTTTAIQSTQNSALSNTDMTTTFVQTGFATIGGRQVVSQQLLDQTAINFDRVIMNDLASDYSQRVGTQIYTGTGTGSGTGAVVNGLQAATAGSTQTWTQASPTPALFYSQAGSLLSKFVAARLMPPSHWVMSPRRWYWLASATDSTGRPYVVPTGNAYNPLGTESNGPVAMGQVGTMHGLPVVIDPLVPLTVSSNQDLVYLLKADDLVLFESPPQAEAFRETYADSVGVLFRLFGYLGTVLNRHPESIGVMTGTGLAAPTFAG